jgi:hypothetical protein
VIIRGVSGVTHKKKMKKKKPGPAARGGKKIAFT